MMLNVTWLWVSAAAAFICWAVHTFVGGPRIVPPLQQSNLPDMPRQVLYFVWHIPTIVIFAFAVGFALAAIYPAAWPLAVQATVLCALIAALIIGVAITRRMSFKDMPQWTLFLLIALTGAAAIWL